MGGSYSFYKDDVAKYLKKKFNQDSTILDVGAGCGTYYEYLHDYFKNIDAVEIFRPNIEMYDLNSKYRKVYFNDIKGLEYDFYDIIIFGDVLEHLEVKEAQEVLKYALNRCNEVIVAVPYMYEQDAIKDNVFEIHKQPDLTKENMKVRYPELKLLYGNDAYGYYVKK